MYRKGGVVMNYGRWLAFVMAGLVATGITLDAAEGRHNEQRPSPKPIPTYVSTVPEYESPLTPGDLAYGRWLEERMDRAEECIRRGEDANC